jgi:hypothetical protein
MAISLGCDQAETFFRDANDRKTDVLLEANQHVGSAVNRTFWQRLTLFGILRANVFVDGRQNRFSTGRDHLGSIRRE